VSETQFSQFFQPTQSQSNRDSATRGARSNEGKIDAKEFLSFQANANFSSPTTPTQTVPAFPMQQELRAAS
jgi:hypothetical protein